MQEQRRTLAYYITGFAFSVLFTIDAFLLVSRHFLTGNHLIAAIIALALAQFAVQLICFLHLGQEVKPRWNLLAFFFMLTVVLIVVVGSLWIMSHLNYNMSPTQTTHFIQQEEGIKP